MKKLLIASLTLSSFTAGAQTNPIDRIDAARGILRQSHVEGKKIEARSRAGALLAANSSDSALRNALKSETAGASSFDRNEKLEKAVKFITGHKTEVYCQGVGLVEMTGNHNDGSWSKITLLESKRKLAPNAFSVLESGEWSYEMGNSYRKPQTSELILISSTANSFHIKETRALSHGPADKGEFVAKWQPAGEPNSMTTNFGGQGQVFEPIPVYLASDFHLWGNSDLGYKIKFTPGFKDFQVTTETGAAEDIQLNSSRVVGTLKARYETRDSKGVERSYENCYPVEYDIQLKETMPLNPKIKGEIDQAAVRAAVKMNFSQINRCIRQALKTDPSLRGHLSIKWDIDDEGRALKVRMGARSLTGDYANKEDMLNCMMEKIRAWKFPAAAQGQTADVEFPFRINE